MGTDLGLFVKAVNFFILYRRVVLQEGSRIGFQVHLDLALIVSMVINPDYTDWRSIEEQSRVARLKRQGL